MANFEFIGLILRGVQALFALIVLGTGAYVASVTSGSYYGYYYSTPSSVAFIIFCAIWTLLVVAFQVGAPRYFAKAAHKFVVLGLDAVTMLFWFAGFIALAVAVGVPYYTSNLGKTAQACTAFAAFEWVLFVATTVLLALNVFRGGAHKHEHHVDAHVGV